MKRFILILSLGLTIGMSNINKSEAQVHVTVNVDIQPAWGPSGYNYAEYYYIPELNIYYDVIQQLFYYSSGGTWRYTRFLPVTYSYYDFYSLYKVVINNVLNPWKYNRNHMHLYREYRHNYNQVPIYCMHDHVYHRARINYHGWVEPRYMPHNDGRPRSRDFSVNTRNGQVSNSLRSSGANEALKNHRSSGTNRPTGVSRTSSTNSTNVKARSSNSERSSGTSKSSAPSVSKRSSERSSSGRQSTSVRSSSRENSRSSSNSATRSRNSSRSERDEK